MDAQQQMNPLGYRIVVLIPGADAEETGEFSSTMLRDSVMFTSAPLPRSVVTIPAKMLYDDAGPTDAVSLIVNSVEYEVVEASAPPSQEYELAPRSFMVAMPIITAILATETPPEDKEEIEETSDNEEGGS